MTAGQYLQRQDKTPRPDRTFGQTAPILIRKGLAPVPVGGDDGKTPLMKGWQKRRWWHSDQSINEIIDKFPTANIGIVTGRPSAVTVIDIDSPDPDTIERINLQFGRTPLITATPSGGRHLWYRYSGERKANLRPDLPVDVQTDGAFIVVPPSVRPTGEFAGKHYEFIAGGWESLSGLPPIGESALKQPGNRNGNVSRLRPTEKGRRNAALFRYCLQQAPYCDTIEDILDVAHTENETYLPPLAYAEVFKTARSAFQYEVEGRNWIGREGYSTTTKTDIDRLNGIDPKRGGDALMLLNVLNIAHCARAEPFAVAPRAMANKTLPWSHQRITAARDVLLRAGFLKKVKKGGAYRGDVSLYELS